MIPFLQIMRKNNAWYCRQFKKKLDGATIEYIFFYQIEQGAYNTDPVEAIVRSVAHHFRAKGFTKNDCRQLKFLEVGCGADANLGWLAVQGVRISGNDISQEALSLCQKVLKHKG